MTNGVISTEPRVSRALVQAYGHPVGYAILRVLVERGTASGKEIAAAVPKPRSTVGDQLRRLQADGLIECVREESRRGTTERFYRITPFACWVDDEEMSHASTAERRRIGLRVLQSAVGDASTALAANTLDRRDNWCLSSMRLAVDAQGWKELADIQRRALEEVERALDESDERLMAGAGGERLLALCSVMLLELPEVD
jgi:DNA-binding transcriptional ArsR family regulator